MKTFDYTESDNKDSLKGGMLQGYRLMHWLVDILKNWFSDPINIKDERISKLLKLQDGDAENKLDALFDIGTPYSPDSRKACTTPMIIVGIGQTLYNIKPFSYIGGTTIAENGAKSMYTGVKHKSIDCVVTVCTESYDGTVLLAGLIEDFLCINEQPLCWDNGMISKLEVLGSTAPEEVKQGTAVHAKQVYQTKISIRTYGGLSWTTDTQGPVYRGMHVQTALK